MPPEARGAFGVRTVRWSDPASWPDGKVPGAGDAVTIARDKDIVLDVSPPALRSLTINGKLSFANERDLALKTDWIYLPGGELDIGSEAKPYTHKATITLTDNVPDEDINTMGDRGIMMLSGTLEPARRPRATPGPSSPRRPKAGSAADRGAQRRRLAQGRRDRPRLDRLRSAPGRGAHHHRRQRQRAHARQAAAVHALRRDHLRRRRARRSRPADAATSRSRRRTTRRRPTSAGTSWRWPGRRCTSRASSSTAWARTCTWPAIRSTGTSLGDGARAVHRELLDPRHLQPLRDGARHQRPADRRTT